MSAITPVFTFTLGGAPDWMALTDDAVWISDGPLGSVHRLDVKTNQVAATIATGKRPCSGLGAGSVWHVYRGNSQACGSCDPARSCGRPIP